jgi:hypothetical protein
VLVDGKVVGTLTASKTAEVEVMIEWGPAPKKIKEEVVTQMTGEIEFPAGRHDVLLIPRQIVDGKLEKVSIE